MKNRLHLIAALVIAAGTAVVPLKAQQLIYKEPVLKIDFGNSSDPGPAMKVMEHYRREFQNCPNDGQYSFSPHTSDCFNGDWITINEDHTPGDVDGRMMLVNASETPGLFFQQSVDHLKENTMYQLSAWIVNVCRTSSPCNPTPPNLSFVVLSASGELLIKIRTGVIQPTNRAAWLRYFNEFVTPPGVTGIVIKMYDDTHGGCGNDFAIDDIMLREVELVKPEPPKPTVVAVTKPVSPKPTPKKEEPVIPKKETAPVRLQRNNQPLNVEKTTAAPIKVNREIRQRNKPVPVPDVLLTRTNPVIKSIKTEEAEMQIDLYDNGEIDGDTISVYDNNVLLVSRAGLSEKAVTLRIKVDKDQPHHELVMVANNLGSIPPNTSLMVITANKKRYEIFISSSNQNNAKILIDLLE